MSGVRPGHRETSHCHWRWHRR